MSTGLDFALPTGWLWSPLKFTTTFVNRGTAPDYVDNGFIRAISQAANQLSGLDWTRTRFSAHQGNPRRLKGYLLYGDVLVNSTGNGTLGRVGYFTEGPDDIPCVADGHVTIARADRKVADPRFMYYWLGSAPFYNYIYSALVVGATNQIELNREGLAGAPIALPPLDVQRRIAGFLDAETARIDGLASAQRQAKALILERRAAKAFALVTGADAAEQAPSRLAWASSLPATWRSVKLGHFARMGSGHTPSRSHPEWWEDCTIPWITTGEVSQIRDDRREVLTDTRERISEIGIANSAAELHPKDTVVLCRTASAGYSAVMGKDMATSQDFVTWTCGSDLDPYYLLWCLRAMRADLLGRLAMGSTHKTIYVPDLQALRIPLPPLGEQHEIVAAIRASNAVTDGAVDVIDHQAELLAERRQALITEAVTGGITV